MPSLLMISGGSASVSRMEMRTMLRSAITIEREYKMSITNKGQIMRRPTHPGEMLREDFLPDFRLTASELARAIECPDSR